MQNKPVFCHVCGGGIHNIDNFSSLIQVTSDCQPWKKDGNLAICQVCGTVQKPVTDVWLREADAIYGGYEIYSQSGGVEQSTFDQLTGTAQSRSEKLVEWLVNKVNLPDKGKLLDIGCGNGAFLRAFSSVYPNYAMTGLELNSRNRAVVEAIPGVELLHVGSVETLPHQFHIISLIHALEHIPDPARFLHNLQDKIVPNGVILLQVPNLKTSPFDILIADHCSHFTGSTLLGLLKRSSFSIIRLDEDYIPKELTAAIGVGNGVKSPLMSKPEQHGENYTQNTDITQSHIDYLQDLLSLGESVTGSVGIFGTSIGGTWLAQSLNDRISFFVDEDPDRIGRRHLNKPIVSTHLLKNGDKILVPLPPLIAHRVVQRLSHLDCEFILPAHKSNELQVVLNRSEI